MEIPISQLGVTLSEDYEGWSAGLPLLISHGQGFFVNGYNYLRCLLLGGQPRQHGNGRLTGYSFRRQRTPQQRSCPLETMDAAYELGEDTLTITARPGRPEGGLPRTMRQALAAGARRVRGGVPGRGSGSLRRSPPRPSPPRRSTTTAPAW